MRASAYNEKAFIYEMCAILFASSIDICIIASKFFDFDFILRRLLLWCCYRLLFVSYRIEWYLKFSFASSSFSLSNGMCWSMLCVGEQVCGKIYVLRIFFFLSGCTPKIDLCIDVLYVFFFSTTLYNVMYDVFFKVWSVVGAFNSTKSHQCMSKMFKGKLSKMFLLERCGWFHRN